LAVCRERERERVRGGAEIVTSVSNGAVTIVYQNVNTFQCGSWTYQSDVVNFLVDKDEIDLGDFYDNQEWLLMDARLRNGTTRMQENSNESVAMVSMRLSLKTQKLLLCFQFGLSHYIGFTGSRHWIPCSHQCNGEARKQIQARNNDTAVNVRYVADVGGRNEVCYGKRAGSARVIQRCAITWNILHELDLHH
ncbi:hypothetical protein COOONC_26957, partial [Cooperia oncophora]